MSTPVTKLKNAQAALQEGNLSKAERLCRKLLANKELYLHVRVLLAKIMINQGDLEAAAQFSAEAAMFDQSNIDLQLATADVLEKQSLFNDAFPFIQRALGNAPDNSVIWRKMLNNLLLSARQEASIETNDDNNDIHGVIPDQLLSISNKALETFPNDLDLVTLIGEIYQDANQLEAALSCFNLALEARPPIYAAHENWLLLQLKMSFFEKITDHAERHKDVLEQNALMLKIVASALEALGDPYTAHELLQKALQLDPHNVGIISARGALRRQLGMFSEAIEDLDYAISLDPEAIHHYNSRRFCYLNTGRLAEAARDESYRFVLPTTSPIYKGNRPLWEGQPLSGKRLYIWCDEGVGDIFKFGPMLREIPSDCHLIFATFAKAIPFIEHILPDAEIRLMPPKEWIRYNESTLKKAKTQISKDLIKTNLSDFYLNFKPKEEDFDYQIPLGRLYGHLRPDLGSFASKTYPFELEASHIDRFMDLDIMPQNNVTKVGLAWTSKGQSSDNDRSYLEIEDLLPILKLPGFQFFNCQYTVSEKEINALRDKFNIPLFHAPGLDLMNDMLGAAAYTACMDLFVGPSSTSSDIAGSMGVKSLRLQLEKSHANLGQDYVPWYVDQQCVQIPWGKSIHDYLPLMESWLLENKNHRGPTIAA